MKAWKMNVRLVALVATVCCCMTANTKAQENSGTTVTVSPGNLSFGVPTGATISAPQTVNISIGGSGSVTVSNIGFSGANANEFSQTNTCGGALAAPTSCAISVTFTPTPSLSPGVMQNALINFTTSTTGAQSIPLTAAVGAIRIFDPLNVANSNPSATLNSLVTFNSQTLMLSCPAGPSAKLSSSPDGNGNVLVDNFLTFNFGSNLVPQTSTNGLVGNVCPANLGNPVDGGQADCFTSAYQGPGGAGTLDGQDPDSFTNAGNPELGNAAGGVPPIDVSSMFSNESATTPAVTVSMLDGGGKVTSTTLFLVTSCSVVNANTGTETGNPTNQQPSQTLSFDTVVNNLDQYAFDYSLVSQGSITNGDATPTVTNNSITPTQYLALVAGTPFAGTSCIPLASLGGNCALKTQVCTLPNGSGATGANCPQSTTPNFLFTSTFDPPTPISNPASTFGFLEFNDAGNCVGGLEGPEANNSCPQNGLVSFTGPGENASRRGAGSVNSSAIAVTGVAPPTTTVAVTPFFSAGSTNWTNGSPMATFTGNPGPSGSFVAPINFIDYGINPASQGLPPTFPIPFPGNSAFAPDNVLQNVACPSGSTPYPPSEPPFTPGPVSLGTLMNNTPYLLHFSTTDCAATHELLFTLNGGSWSTSFNSLALMADTTAPTIAFSTPPSSGGSFTANQKVKAAYTCSDTESGVTTANCAGTVPVGSNIDTTPTNGLTTTKTFTVKATDNVGNTTGTVPVTYTVTCNYAGVTLNPSSVTRPALVGITASVADCMTAPQSVKVQFSLSGPLGKNCSNSSTVLFTTPTFTIKSGTSNSITFPFPIAKNACAGTYTVITTTLQGSNNTTIDTVTSTLMVH
jgi:hypothetical protein